MGRNATLKEMVKAANEERTAASVITHYLSTTRQAEDAERNRDRRATHVFHPSSLGSPCDRRLQFDFLGLRTHQDPHTAKLQATFDVGSAVHDAVHEWLGRAGILYGEWKCKDCRLHIPTGTIPSRAGCKVNDKGKHRWKYVEIKIFDKRLMIGGSTDGVIQTDRLRVLEVKSCHKDKFKKLSRSNTPEDGHKVQGHAYAYGLGLDEIDVLYFSKNDSEWLSMIVPFDRRLWKEVEDRLFSIRDDIDSKALSIRAGHGPGMGICGWCPFNKVCWTTDSFSRVNKMIEEASCAK